MSKLKFSIVIPTYNRAELLQRCLQSVISQTFQNWEAIVVDNFSNDNTEEIVKSFNDERIIFVKNHNYGVIAVSRNKALDMAKGEWICFLDSDDRWFPNKLETILPYTNDYDLIYHGYRRSGAKLGFFTPRNVYFYDIKEPAVPYVLCHGDPVNPSCSALSRTILGDTRFSEDRDLIAVEDYDFFLQILAKGIKIKYLKKTLTFYDVNGISLTTTNSDREEKIYKRWNSYLDENHQHIYKYGQMITSANCLRVNGELDQAKTIYKKILSSPDNYQRKFALKRLLLCYVLKIKNLF